MSVISCNRVSCASIYLRSMLPLDDAKRFIQTCQPGNLMSHTFHLVHNRNIKVSGICSSVLAACLVRYTVQCSSQSIHDWGKEDNIHECGWMWGQWDLVQVNLSNITIGSIGFSEELVKGQSNLLIGGGWALWPLAVSPQITLILRAWGKSLTKSNFSPSFCLLTLSSLPVLLSPSSPHQSLTRCGKHLRISVIWNGCAERSLKDGFGQIEKASAIDVPYNRVGGTTTWIKVMESV